MADRRAIPKTVDTLEKTGGQGQLRRRDDPGRKTGANPTIDKEARRRRDEQAMDRLCIDTIRTLAMDAVQQANSGHPGTPMALAPVAYTVWQRFLNYDPEAPAWPNRDRFVLSNGHASMLLYALLHLAGVKSGAEVAVTLDDIKRFRQLDGKCPGHPEYHLTSGVETTTGPLGQGCGNSVGMAIARHWLAKHFNRSGFTLFDYDIYTLCGDGDMMEGITSEAASLAGHLMLGGLCWIYDSNRITIEGHTDLAFSDDVEARFPGRYGWNVQHVGDANDTDRVAEAIANFQGGSDAPMLIIVDSHIGYGAPHKQDTSAAHGEPLGVEEIRLAKRFYGWPEDSAFLVPDGVREHFRAGMGQRGEELRKAWSALMAAYRAEQIRISLTLQLDRIEKGELLQGLGCRSPPAFPPTPRAWPAATSSRQSAECHRPALSLADRRFGRSLAFSTKTNLTFEAAGSFEAEKYGGRNLHFGIREHAMGAVLNGLAVSKIRPYGSSFLVFSDYMKPSIRLAALMGLPVVTIFTHDSIGVGEDGPTHQPVEQLIGLRSIPHLVTLRPADANEVAEAWRVIIGLQHPVSLVLSRQPLPTIDRKRYAPAAGVARGAYVVADAKRSRPAVILIGTGSEFGLCVTAFEALEQEGIAARLVSMPSWELFEQQDQAYRDSVLPPGITARVSVEAGSVIGWDRYVGSTGARIGMHGFGASAPIKDVDDPLR